MNTLPKLKQLPVFFLLLVFSLSSCKKDGTISSDLTTGTWAVTLFSEDGNDGTHQFKGYEFYFDVGGRVAATNGNTTVYGTWSAGSNDIHQQLELHFGTPRFDKLAKSWQAVEQGSKRLKLQNNNGADLLTLERI